MDFETDFADEFVNTSHGSVHVMHHNGNAQKLVFLHGIGANARTWRKLVPYLSNDYDTYLVELLGHGKSADPDTYYNVALQVSVVGEVMAAMRIDEPFLIGHSYGAWVASFIALKTAVKGIVLIDPAGVKEHFDEIMSTEGEEQYKDKMLKLLLELGNKEHVMRSVLESDFRSEYLSKEVLSRLRIPALVVWGSEDPLVPPKFAHVVAGEISGSELKVVDGAGHDPHYTKPEEVASYLNGFISSIR